MRFIRSKVVSWYLFNSSVFGMILSWSLPDWASVSTSTAPFVDFTICSIWLAIWFIFSRSSPKTFMATVDFTPERSSSILICMGCVKLNSTPGTSLSLSLRRLTNSSLLLKLFHSEMGFRIMKVSM